MTPDWLPDWRDASAYRQHWTPEFSAWQFLRRNPEYQRDYKTYAIKDPDGVLRKKFGIDRGLDPSESKTWPPFVFDSNIGTAIGLWFDFAQPLKPQLDRAKKTLQQRREEHARNNDLPESEYFKEPRYRPDKFVLYLRVLDAVAVRATRADIAKVLFPDKEYKSDPEGLKRRVSELIKEASVYLENPRKALV